MTAPVGSTWATVRRNGLEAIDVERLRLEFPVLHQKVHGKPLIYLDNAASCQKPAQVIEAIARFYRKDYANIHRGLHALSERATAAYEEARDTVRAFLNARDQREIVFVRGTTEAINLVAHSYGRSVLGPGDEVLITGLEHHSNIVPWQLVCEERGARLRVAPIDQHGDVDLAEFERRLGRRTRIVAVAHVSNALGTVNPVVEMCRMARDAGAAVLVDGAQAVPHLAVDVQALDCDFYAFSGHKIYGPTGIGVLYGRLERLESMPPYQGGGEMIASVTFERSTFKRPPFRFEAGTPSIADAVGLGAALRWVEGVGLERIAAHEGELVAYALERLQEVPGVRLIGSPRRRASLISFVLEGIHPHDLGTVLDRQGVAVRAGHHCAQPVMDFFGVPATTRASFAAYNSRADVDGLIAGLHEARRLFR